MRLNICNKNYYWPLDVNVYACCLHNIGFSAAELFGTREVHIILASRTEKYSVLLLFI